MPNRFAKSILIGIKRRWKSGVAQALSVIGAIWLLTEIATAAWSEAHDLLQAHGNSYVLALCIAAICWFFWHIYESRSVTFLIPTTETRITIKFGDLFKEKSDWLIGVNEFFDGEIGQIVSQESVHGKFIAHVYGGNSAKFRADVESALSSFDAIPTTRAFNPSHRYPIGTTAVLENGRHRAFLVAMAHTQLSTSKASATVSTLWDALRVALQSVNDFGNGAPISMPLIGNGRSSVNIEPQHLLRLIVLSLVDFGRKIGLPKEVSIIVPEQCFELLDLREIERDWRTK